MTINNLNVNPHRIEQTRDYKTIFTQLNFLLMLTYVILFVYPYSVFSAPKTPSQALPKMFQQPTGMDYYDFKKQEKVIPNLPSIDVQQQEDTGIEIIPETLIILAPKELQKIISLEKFQDGIVGVPQSIKSLYAIALKIEKEFNDKGFPLVRVILPVQELEQEQATIFFKVINGFIEKIDLTKVPKKTNFTNIFLSKTFNK